MNGLGERQPRLAAAAQPRRANANDAGALARLFAAAFLDDPLFGWIARSGTRRAEALERFFFRLLRGRVIPCGEVWVNADRTAAAAWLPPGRAAHGAGLFEQLNLFSTVLRLCGVPRFARGAAAAEAMEKNRPKEGHYYLAFVAVAPRLQGMGLGSALLETTLARVDRLGWPAYLENSNPRNTRLYERRGFVPRANIAPSGAPPLISMWRPVSRPGANARPSATGGNIATLAV